MSTKVNDYIDIRDYKEEDVFLAGRSVHVSGLSKDDVGLYVSNMQTIIDNTGSKRTKELIAEYSYLILDVVRCVNANTHQGFSGLKAQGNDLTLDYGVASDYERNGKQLSTWKNERSSCGWFNWLFSSNQPAELNEGQAVVMLGVGDPLDAPKVDSVQYTKDDIRKPTERLVGLVNRRRQEVNNLSPIHKFRNPYVILPKDQFYVKAHAHTTGIDKLQPISFIVSRAQDMFPLEEWVIKSSSKDEENKEK